MLFNSLIFIIFYITVLVTYFNLPNRFRWIMLLGASYYFYMSWNPNLVILIMATTAISFLAGLYMPRLESKRKKKILLFASLIPILLVLFFFKYFNFFSESALELFSLIGFNFDPFLLSLILPVGISFYTFQTLSYIIDIYNNKIEAERHFGIYALYVSFFPQLVAGPIERPSSLIPQLKKEHNFSNEDFSEGVKLMIWGFFKKIVIADNLSNYVDTVYANPEANGGLSLALASFFFAIQIYCDFSGYTDIAIGCARTMGIRLMKNFNAPYLSKNIKEFWGRWHISLSTWFRDYVYIPLGGNRTTKLKKYKNLIITFFLSGLWHGANWTFVIWGSLHGIYLIVLDMIFGAKKAKSENIFISIPKILLTFIFVCVAWIFFRANNVPDAFYIIKSILTNTQINLSSISNALMIFTGDRTSLEVFLTSCLAIFILFAYEIWAKSQHKYSRVREIFWYVFLLSFIFLFGNYDTNSFIYFQF